MRYIAVANRTLAVEIKNLKFKIQEKAVTNDAGEALVVEIKIQNHKFKIQDKATADAASSGVTARCWRYAVTTRVYYILLHGWDGDK